jgi:hypothetical protein
VFDARWDVTPRPSRTGNRELYLAKLPDEVAGRWIAANPPVQAVAAAPVYRLFVFAYRAAPTGHIRDRG